MLFESLHLILAFMAGLVLGLFFFGALWLTVRQLPNSRHPVVLVFGSLLIRLTVVLTGFFFIMGDRWERLAACLLGVVFARHVMTRAAGIRGGRPTIENGRTAA